MPGAQVGCTGLPRKYAVPVFYTLAFAISWAGFVPVVARSRGVGFFSDQSWNLALILPGCGPALAALATVRLAREPGDAIPRLWGAVRWRVHGEWYLTAAILPAVLLLSAQAISRALLPHQAPVLPAFAASAVLSTALMSVAANPWEEVGWRGFATTRLQQRYSALTTALIVGTLWALWHIPMFLWQESPMSKFDFRSRSLSVLGQACVLGWLYNSSGQSLAIATVFHVSGNIFGAVIGVHSHIGLAITHLAAAVFLVLRHGPGLTSRS